MSAVTLPAGYELRGASDNEVYAAADFAQYVFGMTRDYFYTRYRRYPGARPEHSRLVLHEGRIVSHHRLYTHDLQFAGANVRAWAIGDVVTDPDHRRKHLGDALLQDSADYARAQGAALILIRASLHAFYCTLGWDPLPLPALRVDPQAVSPGDLPDNGYTTRQFEEPWDLWQVAEVHRQFNAGRSLVRIRDGYYWDRQRVWCSHETGLGFSVAEKDGVICAYGRTWLGHINELCYLPGHEAAATAILGDMVRTAKSYRWPALWGALPADHAAFDALKGVAGAEASVDNHTLLRLVSLRSLLEQIAPSLGARLAGAGVALSAPLTIRCNGEQATLTPISGALRLEDGPADAARVLDLSQRQLLSLCAGITSAAATLPEADAGLVAEMNALFPPGNPIYWNADNV